MDRTQYPYALILMINDDMLLSTFSESAMPFVPSRSDVIRDDGAMYRVLERVIEYHVPAGVTATLYLERI